MDTIKPVQTVIDGVNLNGRHFAGMPIDKALEAMRNDGILEAHGKDEAWARKAHAQIVLDVKAADTPPPVVAIPKDGGSVTVEKK